MIDNRFQRVKPNKARKVPSTTLGCAMVIDYAALVAPMGGTQPLGLVLALLVQQKKTPIWCLFLLAPNAGLEPATT